MDCVTVEADKLKTALMVVCVLQDRAGVDTAASPPGKGMRGIMQRALQQARAEAAAQAQGNTQPASDGAAPGSLLAASAADSIHAAQLPAAGKDKKALGALLKRAAQKMQQEGEKDTTDVAVPQAAPAGSLASGITTAYQRSAAVQF